jgi:hypothetical protein
MNALISPNERAQYISAWDGVHPVFTIVGQRVAQVQETVFDVAQPMFWITCADDVKADRFYYDPEAQNIIVIPDNAPRP